VGNACVLVPIKNLSRGNAYLKNKKVKNWISRTEEGENARRRNKNITQPSRSAPSSPLSGIVLRCKMSIKVMLQNLYHQWVSTSITKLVSKTCICIINGDFCK